MGLADSDDSRAITAVHEAGHALLAAINGQDLGGTSVVPNSDDGTNGRFYTNGLQWDSDHEPLEQARQRWMAYLLAGEAAQLAYFRREAIEKNTHDLQNATKPLQNGLGWTDNEIREYLADRLDEAFRLCTAHWPEIQRLAEALLDQDELDGDEIQEILNPDHGE